MDIAPNYAQAEQDHVVKYKAIERCRFGHPPIRYTTSGLCVKCEDKRRKNEVRYWIILYTPTKAVPWGPFTTTHGAVKSLRNEYLQMYNTELTPEFERQLRENHSPDKSSRVVFDFAVGNTSHLTVDVKAK